MKEYVIDSVRIQALSDDIVRIEQAENGRFNDADTFFVPDKAQYRNTAPKWSVKGRTATVGAYTITVPNDGLSGVTVKKNGKTVYEYAEAVNTGELPPPRKTPAAYAVHDTPRITVPDGGYTFRGDIPNSGYVIEENAKDVYLLLCDGDAKKLRRLYVELTGRNEMVRLATFGGWNSKYYVYDEASAKQLILDYAKHDVPLDVMVIDTDWRAASDRGIGYDIDTKLFPDMRRFMDFAHDNGVEIMFNDHPEPQDGADSVLSPCEAAYREQKLQSLMEVGLDGWWYDRNWHTKLKSPTDGVAPETWGMHIFEEAEKHYYQAQSGDASVYRRPVMMANVNNVFNGMYLGIADSASHRYSIQWTGDINSDYAALAQEVATLVRATNNCVAYVNADCGGHVGNPDREQFVRWMQFGTLSPVFRPHCTISVERSREPWVYDGEVLDIVREYNKLRYRLLPVIYKNAFAAYMTGEPMFKGLWWEYPSDAASDRDDEYMLGNDILVAPVIGDTPSAIKAGDYAAPVSATYYDGKELKGAPIAAAVYETLDMSVKDVSPENGVPPYDFSAVFETAVKFDKPTKLYVRSDDGTRVFVDGELVLDDWHEHGAMLFYAAEMKAGKTHSVKIEYFQAQGAACCGLYACEKKPEETRTVYLPAGEWIYAFDGTAYDGGRTVEIAVDALREMPLFVRRGALLPLAYDAENTKRQRWDRLVYDFYPSKNACDEGYLYEDDGETTAYKQGEYRTSAYKAGYDKKRGAYAVTLGASVGEFKGDRAVASRKITLKCHFADGEALKKAVVNGAEIEFETVAADKTAFPFGTGASPDGETTLVSFDAPVAADCEILLYLKK